MGGLVSLGSSIKYLENIGMNKIKRYILNLNDYLIQSLKELNKEYKRPIIRMITRDMCAVCSSSSLGNVSFNVEEIESIEIAQILSDNNIYVRENNDCMNIQKQSIRVSLGIYKTRYRYIYTNIEKNNRLIFVAYYFDFIYNLFCFN